MKSCIGCIYANWKRTAKGNLHPSGDGRCEYPWVPPPLPASMYFLSFSEPKTYGGHINRHKDATDCPTREVKP